MSPPLIRVWIRERERSVSLLARKASSRWPVASDTVMITRLGIALTAEENEHASQEASGKVGNKIPTGVVVTADIRIGD